MLPTSMLLELVYLSELVVSELKREDMVAKPVGIREEHSRRVLVERDPSRLMCVSEVPS